jgi:hypothetical protein
MEVAVPIHSIPIILCTTDIESQAVSKFKVDRSTFPEDDCACPSEKVPPSTDTDINPVAAYTLPALYTAPLSED